MPTYEYRCETNNEIVEVSHSMMDELRTWGELCERAGIDIGKTPADAPIAKVISLGFVKSSSGASGGGPEFGGCGPSCGCVGHN